MLDKEHWHQLKKSIQENNNCRSWNYWVQEMRKKNPMFSPQLQGASFLLADLKFADLRKANLQQARLDGSNLSFASLRGANLDKAYLETTDMNLTDLSNASLKNAHLKQANLWAAILVRTNFTAADFTEANLSEACLREADLSYCTGLETAKIIGANFYHAILPINVKPTVIEMHKKILASIVWINEEEKDES